MSPSRRSNLFICVILLFTIINTAFITLSVHRFPGLGGFSREILFIKPNEGSDGYFIMLDELSEEAQAHEIDWLLHTRGELNISSDNKYVTATVPSYLTGDDISLQAYFMGNIKSITPHDGHFYPRNLPDEFPDQKAPYIKARYSGKDNPMMGTLLFPKNDSDMTQEFPVVENLGEGLNKIGKSDYLFRCGSKTTSAWLNSSIKFTGKVFFARDGGSKGLEYCFLENSNNFTFNEREYFSSNLEIKNFLANYEDESQISGYVETNTLNQARIKIYCPLAVETVKINEKSINFNQRGSHVSFLMNDSGSFVVSKRTITSSVEDNPLRETPPIRVKPREEKWFFNTSTALKEKQHPYLLFDSNERDLLQLKIIMSQQPWAGWYDAYLGDTNLLSLNPNDYGPDDEYNPLYQLILKYAVDESIVHLNKIREFFFNLDGDEEYEEDLDRSKNVQAYSIAYDLIHDAILPQEQEMFANTLEKIARPLMNTEVYSDNNHRVVGAGGLGLAGLALKNETMINKAIETILIYFYSKNPVDGGSYEGYLYNSLSLYETMQLFVALKQLRGYDFFGDPQILATLDFLAETLGPIGLQHLYEDCQFTTKVHEVLHVAAAHVEDSNRAGNYQWIWEQRQQNKNLQGSSKYYYIKGDYAGFKRIVLYNTLTPVYARAFQTRKEIWPQSSMAFFRSSDQPNALFLSFSCKNYTQNHVHLDENSFELWAYGAYIINNPGYPGWGKENYDWTMSSEASNTLLIGGSNQRQYKADGLKTAITSPYFSMVRGEARQIYTDYGAPEKAPLYFWSIISAFFLLAIALMIFLWMDKSKGQTIPYANKENKIKQPSEANKVSSELNGFKLLTWTFIHPFRLQTYYNHHDPFKRKSKQMENLIMSLFIVQTTLFNAIQLNRLINTFTFYSEYWFPEIFELLNAYSWLLLIGLTLLFLLLAYIAIRIPVKFNRYFSYSTLEGKHHSLTRRDISSITIHSLIWQFPVLMFIYLLYDTTFFVPFNVEIGRIFTETTVIEVYQDLMTISQVLLKNLYLVLIFGLPFFSISISIFIKGIVAASEGEIMKKEALKIYILSTLILIIIIFLMHFLLILGINIVFNGLTIEFLN